MEAEIIVVGGGFAGALVATVFGRAGYDVALIDPHEKYPADFRCEKLEGYRFEILRRLGLFECVSRISTHMEELWIARFGRLLDKVPFHQGSFRYEDLVNAVRAQVPNAVKRYVSWAEEIQPSATAPSVRLLDGSEIKGRLVVMASGLNWSLLEKLGMERELLSRCHSLTLGFDLQRTDGLEFAFQGLQYNAERVGDDVGYITLFRLERTMRANLFLYMPLKDPRVARFREDPTQALEALLPRLARLTGPYQVVGPVKIRPTDLQAMRKVEADGVVAIGDAFAVPCPATGTGTLKVLTDVERLREHVPGWLASPGMSSGKIAAFYADPLKRACDEASLAYASRLRWLATDTGPASHAHHWARFVSRVARRMLRGLRRLRPGAPNRPERFAKSA